MPQKGHPNQCQASSKNGTPCRARPGTGQAFCTFHDPSPAAAAAQEQARREGGLVRSTSARTLPADYPDAAIRTIGDLCPLLADTINQVRKGGLDPRVANTVAYLAGVLIRVIEAGDLEQRIARLEAATGRPVNPAGASTTLNSRKQYRNAI